MNPEAIGALLWERQRVSISPEVGAQLSQYLDLLLRWSARTNLSAIRDPEQIVLRHFGESLQCAETLAPATTSLLDFGSGAGFPGMPCALIRPDLAVTLAESQNKKAAFLAELSRTLEREVTVHAGRVEAMPAARRFQAVALRAVDRMDQAICCALGRIQPGGQLIVMTTNAALSQMAGLREVVGVQAVPIRGSDQGVIALVSTQG